MVELAVSNDNPQPIDWYTGCLEQMKDDCVEETGLSRQDVDAVYAWLANFGLIDYDVEKDVLYDTYIAE